MTNKDPFVVILLVICTAINIVAVYKFMNIDISKSIEIERLTNVNNELRKQQEIMTRMMEMCK